MPASAPTSAAATIRAVLVEDDPGDARLIREMLRDASVELVHAERLAGGIEEVARDATDVVLLDLSLPDSSGLETFEAMHAAAPEVAVVVLSGLDDEGAAVRAVQEGAQDYLVKGKVESETLVRSVRYAVERQRLEAVRRELEGQRDEFFKSVSHDLRTPVAAIKAAIGVVLANEPPGTSPALHRLLGNIDLAADELARQIEDLLEMARLQAGRVELYRIDVDLRDVVTRAARQIEPLTVRHGQELLLQLPDQPVMVSVDAGRIGRVLGNLLSNAYKYGRVGGHITVRLDRGADEVCVAVADDGPGIPVAEQEHIFERFYSAARHADGTVGTGLGLPIARALVELHGGRLSVESEPGHGSTFRVQLQVAEANVV